MVIAIELTEDLSDVGLADEINSSSSSIDNWRNRKNDMSLFAFMRGGKRFGAPWLNFVLRRIGFRAVPLDAVCNVDSGHLTRQARLALKIAMATDPSSPGGTNVLPKEAREMMSEIDAFQECLDGWRALAATD